MTSRRARRRIETARRVLAHPGALASTLFLVLTVSLAFLAPWVLPIDPLHQELSASLEPPSAQYWFGADELGRDLLARVVYGARTSLVTAGGFFGGWRDAVLMRFIDVLLALPNILFAMALIAVLGRSQLAALVAVGITGVPSFARITRAQVLSLRQRDFVLAVEALGGSSSYTMFTTVLPNSLSPILVQVVVLSSVAILLEAALSFLGVGIPPPTPSWGDLLRTGKSFLYEAPTYAVLPGIALTLTILSLDTLGRTLAAVLEDRREVAAVPGREEGRT
jgi:ABC-type dipeptide/oligopeptide/nickel transport system permease subunit